MAARPDFLLRKEYFNKCDPNEALTPDDPRYVDVDTLMPDARGRSCVDMLADRIEFTDKPICAFLSGLPGSGKSTEINRLAARLRVTKEAGGPALLPVIIDAEEMLDLHNPITEADVLVMILYMTDAAVLEAEGKDAKLAMTEGASARFWNWLTRTEVGARGAEIGPTVKVDAAGAEVGVGAKLIADFKTSPSLRETVRSRVAASMTTFLRQVSDLLIEMNYRARSYGHEGIVIIVDSLEKVRGLSMNWQAVLTAAEKLFGGGAPYLRLPVHVIYTIPPALVNRVSDEVFFLPMLKIHDREGKPAVGYDAAREIVGRRVPDADLAKIFGSMDLEASIRKLIEWSGGYPREIMKLLQDCIVERSLDERSFRQLIARAGERYTRVVPDHALPLLAKIAKEKRLIFDGEEQRSIVDQLLQTNVILRYQNDEPWVELHPAVRAMMERLNAR